MSPPRADLADRRDTEPPCATPLACYVAPLLLRRLAAMPTLAASRESLHAVVLFADIGGFTAEAERLAQQGDSGAEALSLLLNDAFGPLLDAITARGGEVLCFPGDAVIALWPDGEAQLATATAHAAACALDAQQRFARSPASGLSLRIGLAAGRLDVSIVGGEDGHWECLLRGAPLLEAGRAQADAGAGGVALATSTRIRLAGVADIDDAAPVARLHHLRWSPPPRLRPPAPAVDATLLRPFLPRSALARLDAGEVDWLAELRRVTVLFVAVPDALNIDLDTAQRCCVALQRAVYRYGGSINQYLTDDKGSVLLAAWGVPQAIHEDDAERALLAALAIEDAMHALGQVVRIGVASGRAFCGHRGDARRREYALIGDVVNVAARLMQAAQRGVLCDAATHAAARLACEPLAAVRLKGKQQPVPVFRPQKQRSAPRRDADPASGPLRGRSHERARLMQRFAELRHGQGSTVLLEGEAGIGKSRLVAELVQHAQDAGIRALVTAGSPIETATPYHAWRPLLLELLELVHVDDPHRRGECLRAALAERPELLPRLPLLAALLPFEPSADAAAQSGAARAESIRELVCALVERAVGRRPTLLVFEDLHWFDGASWSLLNAAAQRRLPLMLLLSSRPLDNALLDAQRLLRLPSLSRMPLGPLAQDDLLALIAERLGVDTLPEAVGRLILQRAEGNPFFSEELAYALRDAGVLMVEDGRCRLLGGLPALQRLDLPDNVHGVISSRIDRLPPGQDLTLKVGSVFGRHFDTAGVAAVHPLQRDFAAVSEALGMLVTHELVQRLGQPNHSYRFKHAITREVAYGLLPYAQRRLLHRRVAEWIEQAHADDLHAVTALLAHHWNLADAHAKALFYLERAGRQAAATGAHRDAAEHFSRALERAGAIPAAVDRLQLARWRRQLGDALWGLGDLAAATDQSRLTLHALGDRAPTTTVGWLWSLARQASIAAWYKLVGAPHPRDAQRQAMAAEAARAAQRIAERHYYALEGLPMLAASLAATNLSQRAGHLAPVARSYGMLGLVVGLCGMRRIGERWLQHACRYAYDSGNLHDEVFVSYAHGGLLLGLADWQALRPIAERGEACARALGDPQELEVALTVQGHLAFYTGDYADSLARFDEVRRLADGRSLQHTAWGHYAMGRALLFRGDLEAAIEQLQAARRLLDEVSDEMSQIICDGLLALALLRSGRLTAAEAQADCTMRRISINAPNVFAYVEPYAAVLEVRLASWRRARGSGGSVRTARRQARQAARQLFKLALAFPLARARYAALAACVARLAGRESVALRRLAKAARLAERYGLPWDRAFASHHLSLSPRLSDQRRRAAAEEAAQRFAALRAERHLQALRATTD